MTHTPGPWVVSGTTDDGFCIPNVAYLMGVNAEANAHLIAAAPDLLAAVEAILQEFTPTHLNKVSGTAVGTDARDAIAKAKGD